MVNNKDLTQLFNNKDVMQAVMNCMACSLEMLDTNMNSNNVPAASKEYIKMASTKCKLQAFNHCYYDRDCLHTFSSEVMDAVIAEIKGHIFFIAHNNNSDYHNGNEARLCVDAIECLRLNQFLAIYEIAASDCKEEDLQDEINERLFEEDEQETMDQVIQKVLDLPMDYIDEPLQGAPGKVFNNIQDEDEYYTHDLQSYVAFVKYCKTMMEEDDYYPRLVVGEKVLNIDYLPIDEALCGLSATNTLRMIDGILFAEM